VDAVLLAAAVWRTAGVDPRRFLGEHGGRALAAVAALAVTSAAGLAIVSGAGARVVIGATATMAFGVGVWRYVLDDAERAGLRRVFT
jgi:hypothetical protein